MDLLDLLLRWRGGVAVPQYSRNCGCRRVLGACRGAGGFLTLRDATSPRGAESVAGRCLFGRGAGAAVWCTTSERTGRAIMVRTGKPPCCRVAICLTGGLARCGAGPRNDPDTACDCSRAAFSLDGLHGMDRPQWPQHPFSYCVSRFDHFLGVALGIAMVVLVLESARTRTRRTERQDAPAHAAHRCQHADALGERRAGQRP